MKSAILPVHAAATPICCSHSRGRATTERMERRRYEGLSAHQCSSTGMLRQAAIRLDNTSGGFRRPASSPVDCRRIELEAADV